jgi:hypothetical protein
VLGFVTYNVVGVLGGPTPGDQVRLDCQVPTYDFDTHGVATLDACVGGGIGTFWELVK